MVVYTVYRYAVEIINILLRNPTFSDLRVNILYPVMRSIPKLNVP